MPTRCPLTCQPECGSGIKGLAGGRYLDDYTLRDMLKRYSEFISFPIELWSEKTEYDDVQLHV